MPLKHSNIMQTYSNEILYAPIERIKSEKGEDYIPSPREILANQIEYVKALGITTYEDFSKYDFDVADLINAWAYYLICSHDKFQDSYLAPNNMDSFSYATICVYEKLKYWHYFCEKSADEIIRDMNNYSKQALFDQVNKEIIARGGHSFKTKKTGSSLDEDIPNRLMFTNNFSTYTNKNKYNVVHGLSRSENINKNIFETSEVESYIMENNLSLYEDKALSRLFQLIIEMLPKEHFALINHLNFEQETKKNQTTIKKIETNGFKKVYCDKLESICSIYDLENPHMDYISDDLGLGLTSAKLSHQAEKAMKKLKRQYLKKYGDEESTKALLTQHGRSA